MSNDICQNCGGKIEIAIFKGSGYCSEWCKRGIARLQDNEEFVIPVGSEELIKESFDIHDGAGNVVRSIDPATIIYEQDDEPVDLNVALKICTEGHDGAEEAEGLPVTAFGHDATLMRLCMRVSGVDVWVYDPAWEKIMLDHAAAQANDEVHEH